MNPIRSVIITGANAGLGRECARQLALKSDIEKIYLGCRSKEKALAAKIELEIETGRKIFEIFLIDVMDPASVRKAVDTLTSPVDAIVLNAGGMGGREPTSITKGDVTNIFAVNILGHAVFIKELLSRELVTSTILYAGSETARGVPRMGIPRPQLESYSTDELAGIADGTLFNEKSDPMYIYAMVKLMAALWMSELASKHPDIRFITMSPGGTAGTNGMDDLPLAKKIFFKYVGGLIMPLFGMMHGVDVGARRYVDGLFDKAYKTGRFYASTEGSPTGPIIDQASIMPELDVKSFQENAYKAIHRYIG